MMELFTEMWLGLRETKREEAVNYPSYAWQGERAGSMEWGKSWVHGTWKDQSKFSRAVALEEHMNCGRQRGSRQDGNPNSS